MRSLWIVFVVGCNLPHDAGCPTVPYGQCSEAQNGDTCVVPTGSDQRPSVCNCYDGNWYCGNCPDDALRPSGACTPNDSCESDGWEYGCCCVCSTAGYWSCTGIDDQGFCSAKQDAGVDPLPDAYVGD